MVRNGLGGIISQLADACKILHDALANLTPRFFLSIGQYAAEQGH